MAYHASLFGLASREHWIIRYGWMGVDLFFVLSGFLIAGQLLKPIASGLRPDYVKFFCRRALRTLPAYLVVVVVYFAFPAVRERPEIQPLWQFLTFTENLLIAPPLPKAFSQAWSLCVEEQFYLILPLILIWTSPQSRPRTIVLSFASVILLGILVRSLLWVTYVPPDGHARTVRYMTLIYWPTWARLDDLVAGVAAATVKVFRPRLWASLTARPNALLLLGLAGAVASMVLFQDQIAGLFTTAFGFPLLAASIGLVVVAGSDRKSMIGRFPVPGAGAMAAGAYSVYLSHKAVFRGVQYLRPHVHDQSDALLALLALVLALVVGAILYVSVERPCLKLRDRLIGPSRSSLRSDHAFDGKAGSHLSRRR